MAERPATVVLVHNRYLERGGEDVVFEAEADLLEGRGHRVLRFEADNRDVAALGPLRLAARTVWSRGSYRALRALVERERADVVHIHNTLPLLSPAAHHAAADAGAAVVQTLHNFRLLCPQGQFLRNGQPCEACLGKAVPWPGALYGCYRGSRPASAAVAGMLTTHRALGTWDRVGAFIALSAFSRGKFIEGGLPAGRIHVRGNFLPGDPGVGTHAGDFLLYVGRLSREKGGETLLEGWRRVVEGGGAGRLVMVGDGPLAERVSAAAAELPGLEWLGAVPPERVRQLMGDARALVLPSITYENSPRVVAEAYARGLPVLGSRHGSVAELVREGETGALFTPGDAADLAVALRWALSPEAELAPLGRGARAAYEAEYTAERGYE
ncbi:MAG TPA: glycosyltransferase, partial [Longimicrobiales bacterium]|nr:glycosyltransferase [Longimicrobiales bacterium]